MAETPRWWTFVTRAGEAWWVVTLTLVAFLARLPVFFRSFASGDEATYSALASAMLDGQWLYVGAVDHKPPLIASTYALVFGAGGRQGIHTVHAVSILVVVATALMIGLVARRLGTGRTAARAASAIYVVWSSIGPAKDMLAANGELLMALPAVSAIAIALSGATRQSSGGIEQAGPGRRSPLVEASRWMAAGALAGVSALFKYQAAAIAAPLALLAFHGTFPARGRVDEARAGWACAGRPAARLALSALGGAIVLAVFIGLYWRQGQLDALTFWAWTYPLRYAGSIGAAAFALNAVTMTALWLLLSAGPLAAVAAGGDRTFRTGPSCAILVVWVVSAAIGVASGGRFFLHYYLQLLPPLAIVAGLGLERLVSVGSAATRRWFLAVGLLTGGLLALTWGLNAADFRLHRDRARHDVIYREVGAFIRSHSEEDDRILVWGNSPEIYYYAGRSMGTRFPFCNYQSGKIWGTPADEPGARIDPRQVLEPAWQMLLADLVGRQPALVVDAAAAGLDRWEGHDIGKYPRLAAMVEARYRPVAVVDRVVIYARRDDLAITAQGAERKAPR